MFGGWKKGLTLPWSGFYPNTLVYSHFPPKIQFIYLLSLHGENWKKNFGNLGVQIDGKYISDTLSDHRSIVCTSFVRSDSNFSWNFKVLWAVSKKSWCNFSLYVFVNIKPISKKNRQIEWKIYQKNTHACVFHKKYTHTWDWFS